MFRQVKKSTFGMNKRTEVLSREIETIKKTQMEMLTLKKIQNLNFKFKNSLDYFSSRLVIMRKSKKKKKTCMSKDISIEMTQSQEQRKKN